MTDTTNTEPTDNEHAQMQMLDPEQIMKTYEAMTEEQKNAVHFLVQAAVEGKLELEEEIPEVDMDKEIEKLHRMSDLLDEAKGTDK